MNFKLFILQTWKDVLKETIEKCLQNHKIYLETIITNTISIKTLNEI